MKSKVTKEYYTWWGAYGSFMLVFHSFLSSLVAQNFYFYIVNTKLQQQWENEKTEKKKKLDCILVGPEGPRSFGPFHLKPKARAEEEEVPGDKWRESKLP